jgi:hypothetical protein
MGIMKKLSLVLLLGLSLLPAAEMPNFHVSDILVLADGFIALKIENTGSQDFTLPVQMRESIFLSLAINGIKRAEYKCKAMDPTIFSKNSSIIFKTNFRVGHALRIRVEVNGEKSIPESDWSNNILEKDLQPRL